MEPKKFNQKLSIKKQTIANLNNDEMSKIYGGDLFLDPNDPNSGKVGQGGGGNNGAAGGNLCAGTGLALAVASVVGAGMTCGPYGGLAAGFASATQIMLSNPNATCPGCVTNVRGGTQPPSTNPPRDTAVECSRPRNMC